MADENGVAGQQSGKECPVSVFVFIHVATNSFEETPTMLRRTTIVACVLSLVLLSAGVASATALYTSFTTLYPAGSDTQAYPLAMNVVNGVPLAAGVTGGGTTNMNQGYPCIWSTWQRGRDRRAEQHSRLAHPRQGLCHGQQRGHRGE